MRAPRVLVAALVLLGLMVAPAYAGVRSVTVPKSVQAGRTAVIKVQLVDVAQCRLTAGKATKTTDTASAISVTYRFTVSKKAKPGTYSLTLRCGSESRKLRLKVVKGKSRRGTSKTLVQGKIRDRVAGRDRVVAPAPTPPCCKPVATPTPAPTPPPVENAFRAVYALAADQAEEAGYVTGIAATIEAVDGWFSGQTGGLTPRWLRSGTAIDVKVVKLARPAAEYESAGGLTRMKADVEAAFPLATASQRSVVWTQTNHPDGACGSTQAGVVWLTEKACNIKPVTPTSWPFDGTYLTAHELTHLLGAVPDCAPHADGTGHVTDDPRDILYAGARDFNNLMLDPGRDDYFATNGATCADIATSPFWERR